MYQVLIHTHASVYGAKIIGFKFYTLMFEVDITVNPFDSNPYKYLTTLSLDSSDIVLTFWTKQFFVLRGLFCPLQKFSIISGLYSTDACKRERIRGAEKDLDGFQAGELLLPDTEFLFTKDTLLKSPLEKWQVLGIGEKIAFYVFWSGDKNLKY